MGCAMGMSNAAKNTALDAVAAVSGFASLHTADPGTTGASEAAGVTRQAITWNAASSGDLDNNANPVFSIPAGTTITHFGIWSASTAGTFQFGGALSSTETYTGSGGTYTLTDADLTLT